MHYISTALPWIKIRQKTNAGVWSMYILIHISSASWLPEVSAVQLEGQVFASPIVFC